MDATAKNIIPKNNEHRRIIVIGSGPVGMRFVNKVLEKAPESHVQLFGNEPFQPYNRVQLSALLAGEVTREKVDIPLPSPAQHPNFVYQISAIRAIDTEAKTVTDSHNQVHSFDSLVIATGARAHVPDIPGIHQTGVYTFRNLKDAESLYARVARSRHIVVVGGGLLGLEAAKGLLRFNTRVTLLQQGPRLMNRQLDDQAASILEEEVESLGITLKTGTSIREVSGQERVTSVKTSQDEIIECDTVLLCAGIKPNIELARAARLKVSTGITVDNQLQTSHPDIFAIGECCEHKGLTYGLVQPGFEQASVAADVILHGQSQYLGTASISRLKVVGKNVCSMGEVVDLPIRPLQSELSYEDRDKGIYRKLVIRKGRLIGAVAIGEWPELSRIQEAFQQNRPIQLWQRLRFRLTGNLWQNSQNNAVVQWPEASIVCQCNNISRGQLSQTISSGCATMQSLQQETGAGTVCGSCKPLLEELVGNQGPREKEQGWLPVMLGSLTAVLLAFLLFLTPEAKVADSVQTNNWFEAIWNDKFWKQVTGFTLLGLTIIGLLMSLRKRLKWAWMGQFSYWRVLHTLLGVCCAAILIFHTGFNLGSNLNQYLMVNFLSVVLLGAFAGAVVSMSHKLAPARAQSVRKVWTWLHILVTWPLPALLGVHILTVYYF